MQAQNILFEVSGQSLFIDIVEGRPTGTPTFSVRDASVGETADAEFSGTGTIESVSATSTALAGHSNTNRRQIALDSVSGIEVGREYLFTSAEGLYEWVEVLSIDSDDLIVIVRSPLQNDYAAGATFVSTRITADVDDTWAATLNNLKFDGPNPDYRILWTYTYNSVTFRRYSYFDLVRVAPHHGVTFNDLLSYMPDLYDKLGEDFRGAAEKIIDLAYEDLQVDLKAADLDISGVRDPLMLDSLVRKRAIFNLASNGYRPLDVSFIEYEDKTSDDYYKTLEQHFTVVARTATAVDSSGSTASSVQPTPFWTPR